MDTEVASRVKNICCNQTDLNVLTENVDSASASNAFYVKPARKYPLNKYLDSVTACSSKETNTTEQEGSMVMFITDECPEELLKSNLNHKIFYDDNYNLNWDEMQQKKSYTKKYMTRSNIARYACYLPKMVISTKLSAINLDLGKEKSKDFFDDATMEYVRHNLFQLSSIDGMVTGGPPTAITFHSTVKARRISDEGKVNILLQWSPENMVPDTWVTEDELCYNLEKTIPVSQLPHEALQLPVMDVLRSTGILPPPGKRKRK